MLVFVSSSVKDEQLSSKATFQIQSIIALRKFKQ